MDIERLTKSQIVLLTLLVSFVTSIATGIVTVSLMDQAPPAIAQTVNRVIERTIEKVATSTVGTSRGQTAATVITQEKTIVVKEADLITEALTRVNPSIVRLYGAAGENATFLGFGVVLDASGNILTDSSALGDRSGAFAVLSDGTEARAFVVRRDEDNGFAYLAAATTTQSGAKIAWNAATLSATHPVLGTTVVMISGKNIPRIADGIVTALIPNSPVIDTNMNGDWIYPGTPLIDTNGALVGVSTGVARASSLSGFIGADVLTKLSAAARTEAAQK